MAQQETRRRFFARGAQALVVSRWRRC